MEPELENLYKSLSEFFDSEEEKSCEEKEEKEEEK